MKRGSPVGPTEAGVYAYTKVMHHFSLLHLFRFLCFKFQWFWVFLCGCRDWLNTDRS